jgi:hypothetical protein
MNCRAQRLALETDGDGRPDPQRQLCLCNINIDCCPEPLSAVNYMMDAADRAKALWLSVTHIHFVNGELMLPWVLSSIARETASICNLCHSPTSISRLSSAANQLLFDANCKLLSGTIFCKLN